MEKWVDHFRVLQVHHLAEQDVIEHTYKKLCKKYHPDVNRSPEAEGRMKEINIAYEVLGNASSRSRYYIEWQKRNQPVRSQVPPPPPPAPTAAPAADAMGHPEARRSMTSYFTALQKSRYQDAYHLLSEIDRYFVSLDSFIDWQESVAETYVIQNFQVKQCKYFDNLLVEGNTSRVAERFDIVITEQDKRTRVISTYVFQKFMIQDGGVWRVYLGYRDLPSITNRFRHSANTKEEAALLSQWEHYKATNDIAHGMVNMLGFIEAAAPEMYRYKRYKSAFALAVVHVDVLRNHTESFKERVVTYVGYELQKQIRITDCIGYIGEDRYALLLPETSKHNTRAALRRMAQLVAQEVWSCFDTKVRLRFAINDYRGEDMENALQRLCLGIGTLPSIAYRFMS